MAEKTKELKKDNRIIDEYSCQVAIVRSKI